MREGDLASSGLDRAAVVRFPYLDIVKLHAVVSPSRDEYFVLTGRNVVRGVLALTADAYEDQTARRGAVTGAEARIADSLLRLCIDHGDADSGYAYVEASVPATS